MRRNEIVVGALYEGVGGTKRRVTKVYADMDCPDVCFVEYRTAALSLFRRVYEYEFLLWAKRRVDDAQP